MIEFKTYLEVIYTKSVLDEIKDKLETDGYATISIDNNGNIISGYHDRDYTRAISSHNKRGTVGINTRSKTLKIPMIGNKIKPLYFKLINFLKQNNIIDNSWKYVNMENISTYVGSKFTDFEREININDIEQYAPNMNNIILYHGTSEKDWEEVKNKGALLPLFIGSKTAGFESRAKSDYNKNHIYLASSEEKAWEYATARSRSVNRITNPESWKYMQHQSPCDWAIKPVVLEVQIPDMLKLKTDDDAIIDRMQIVSRKIWEKKPLEEKQKIIKILQKLGKLKNDDQSIAYMLWRETRKGYAEIMAKFKPSLLKAWYAGLTRTKQVAYSGHIPTKFIKEIKIC